VVIRGEYQGIYGVAKSCQQIIATDFTDRKKLINTLGVFLPGFSRGKRALALNKWGLKALNPH